MVKNINEKTEVIYCMYCGTKLNKVTLNTKKCPNDCVEIKFLKPIDAIEEMFKERKQIKKSSGPVCGCEYPMISQVLYMNKIIPCKNCKKSFWSPSKKMFILWKTDAEGNKLVTSGGYYSFADADAQPLELKDGELKLIEKFYLPTRDFCGSCLNLAKSINKRATIERRKRKNALKIKGNKAIPISDTDGKGFIKFLVQKKIEEDAKTKAKDVNKP